MLSKACEYGIKAAVFLAKASKENRPVNLKEIAKAIDSPEAFTAKVLQQLVRHNIIISVKGAQGGFYIEPIKLRTLTLLEIVAAIDGTSLIKDCVLGLSHCSEMNPCPMHGRYKIIRTQITDMLRTSLVKDLSVSFLKKIVVLKH